MEKIRYYFLWLVGLCVGMFVLQNLPGIPGFTELFILNDRANNGEIWRFVSSIFLHGSPTHLLFNMFALLFFGFSLERLVGSKGFLWIFFLSGILANVISVNYYDSSLGASGAIYGVLGAITILRPMMMVWAFGFIVPMFIAAILWVGADVLRLYGVFGVTNIGSIAHLSGIVVGFIMGVYYLRKIGKTNRDKGEVRFDEGSLRDWEDRFVRER
jgi:membrane associated rhomboid family serine protease